MFQMDDAPSFGQLAPVHLIPPRTVQTRDRLRSPLVGDEDHRPCPCGLRGELIEQQTRLVVAGLYAPETFGMILHHSLADRCP